MYVVAVYITNKLGFIYLNLRSILTPFAVLRKIGLPNIIAPVIVNGSPEPATANDDDSSTFVERLCFVDRRDDSYALPS